MATIKPLVAGNWKMNGTQLSITEIEVLARALKTAPASNCTILICPPATLLRELVRVSDRGPILAGGQSCHADEKGAHTGDISAEMLADAGAKYVIVGHSERRRDHHETDGVVHGKASAALRAGLTAIICVGESLAERSRGVAETVVEHQLDGSVPDFDFESLADGAGIVIAYEPVWAIGTGETPTVSQIAQMHATIRSWLEQKFGHRGARVHILYGGSMTRKNADSFLKLPNVNGGLVGGASLNVAEFLAIVRAA